MGLARTRTVVLVGVEGHVVEVEADITPGLPATVIVGLPDAAVGESRDRVRAAVLNSALPWPKTRITVGLSPASLPKRGSSLDLAIAAGVLAAEGVVPLESLEGVALVGELALDGRVRPVPGVLVAAIAARRAGASTLVVPDAHADEAALVPGLHVVAVTCLRELVAVLRDEDREPFVLAAAPGCRPASPETDQPVVVPDLRDVRGQATARHALEVAAAGGHHLALLGSPGVGKTMLAERLPGLLPDLQEQEALEVTAVHSVAGRLGSHGRLVVRPPYAAPHHTTTLVAMVGGGSGSVARVGLVSVAHRGVLMLDEAPEFDAGVLDALRQPMESGEVTVSRAGFAVTLPARFQLVLAANPCPCGRGMDPLGRGHEPCTCTPHQKRRYLGRISGPLLDRVDLRLVLERPTAADLAFGEAHAEASCVVADRVAQARLRAAARLAGTPWRTNGEVPGPELRRRFPPGPGTEPVLDRLVAGPSESARGVDRVVRLAWTIADLAGHDRPGPDDLLQALGLRSSEGRWAA